MRNLTWMAAALCLSGCIIEAPSGEPGAERARALVRELPTLAHVLGANFGGRVEALGANVSPPTLVPGSSTRVSLFFRVTGAVEEDFVVFVHAEPAGGGGRWLFDHSPAGGYRTSQWRKGEVLKDEFTVSVPASFSGSSVSLWFGLWEPKTDKRLPLRNPTAVVNDGNNRVLLAEIPVAPQ